MSRRDANSIDKDARMYMALNNALLDASITAWDGKRTGSPTSHPTTPPFAAYTSGHSTFSMAGAEDLPAFTGRGNFEMTVTIPAGSSRTEPRTATHPGVPAKPITLKWTNFRYAAEQAGKSRQYGGIHFEDGDNHAREAGANVGKQAWATALTYFNGTAT